MTNCYAPRASRGSGMQALHPANEGLLLLPTLFITPTPPDIRYINFGKKCTKIEYVIGRKEERETGASMRAGKLQFLLHSSIQHTCILVSNDCCQESYQDISISSYQLTRDSAFCLEGSPNYQVDHADSSTLTAS